MSLHHDKHTRESKDQFKNTQHQGETHPGADANLMPVHHFRTIFPYLCDSTEETEGGEVEAYPLLKTGDSAEMTKSQPQSEKAITAPKKKRIRTKKSKSVASASEPLDVTLETTHSESQPSAPERTEPDSSQEQNMVLSEEVSQQVTHPELGPFSKVKGKQRVKDSPIRKADSTEIPQRKYYRSMTDAKTYRMNGQGQCQCQQDPKDVTRVGSVKELPLCSEKPIFHEPVGA